MSMASSFPLLFVLLFVAFEQCNSNVTTFGFSKYFQVGRNNPNTGAIFDSEVMKKLKQTELKNKRATVGDNRQMSTSGSGLQCFTRSADNGKARVMKIRDVDQEKWGSVCCATELQRIVFADKTTRKPNAVCVCQCKKF